jgi:hypothetical protein
MLADFQFVRSQESVVRNQPSHSNLPVEDFTNALFSPACAEVPFALAVLFIYLARGYKPTSYVWDV